VLRFDNCRDCPCCRLTWSEGLPVHGRYLVFRCEHNRLASPVGGLIVYECPEVHGMPRVVPPAEDCPYRYRRQSYEEEQEESQDQKKES